MVQHGPSPSHLHVPHFASPRLLIRKSAGGSQLVRSKIDLGHYARCLGDLLIHWAETAPERTFLAERSPGREGWKSISYSETLSFVKNIAEALLGRDLSAERPVMILSGNSINHALLSLAAMHSGIPVSPISPFYSLASSDFSKLRHVYGLLRPGLVFVENAAPFQRALRTLAGAEFELVSCGEPPGRIRSTRFNELLSTAATERVESAFRAVGPDTVSKILFTSGSTGLPKGVINTQRMMCSNQRSIAQCWQFLSEKPPVTLDWLPWNHTFGSNHNFNMILQNGGTLYIDSGKPTPGQIEATVKNLRDISPTIYFNVPRGYDMLLPYLERDWDLAVRFFQNLDLLFYAAAPLPKNLWNRLKALSLTHMGYEVPLVSAWGATETAPVVTSIHFPVEESDNIGLPTPGSELKMVPNGGKLELRVRGPGVTPGYWRQPEKSREAFDKEGFYCTGDAGKWIDESRPERGIRFDGRIAEDFKLTSGSWVAVGAVRLRLIAAMEPVIQDAVITGHGRDYVAALLFPNIEGLKAFLKLKSDLEPSALLKRAELRAFVAARLADLEKEASASSMCIRRVILMDEPPSADRNEITDKGYINQQAVLKHRNALVEKLYSETAESEVILPSS